MKNRCANSLQLNTRKEREANLSMVFGEKIKVLSMGLQEILLDDMVTAFENRLIVLNRAEVKR